ncbi:MULTISPECIES: hypothetical protein [Tenacibaculum]|uniref:hypothetical protein n=1 Tax=Tenacibaculum TaxID=104267 RepID=UPI000898CF76|nr:MULTISPECIES: hypothetical protein [unclassified Tenacibaculum]RBW56650.1 hypothetical protein DS884_14415 [Tenacibaculum sp. E3R01]SEE54447.1 hypothetical protein SAMN04487765_3038 [Tenacibaculum sp. MAR_2010_89]
MTTVKTDQKKVPKENTEGISPKVISELSKEINNMLSYAIYNGIIINTQINNLIQNSSVDDLINAHNLLSKNIAPATPKSIEFTKKLRSSESGKSIFNKLPLVRNLILLALLFLILFIITGLSPKVNNHSLDEGIMNNNGFSLLLNLTFLSSISGLGVLFFLLKKVSDSIKNTTLVAEESISYIAQITLGIIAGLIMSEIISFYSTDPKNIDLFSKSILALIGGFSSDAIFSVLQGIIDRIKSIFTSPIIK